MAYVEALKDIYSTVRSVDRRAPRERFHCPDALALELAAYGMVKVLEGPKPQGASSDGRKEQPASSSQAAPAPTKSKSTTLQQPTKKTDVKR